MSPAKNLPRSLKLDRQSGIISGKAPEKAAEYLVTLIASNKPAKMPVSYKVVGDKIRPDGAMGWNDWYTHYEHVTFM